MTKRNALRAWAFGACAAVSMAGAAHAQSPSSIRAVCEKSMLPAMARINRTLDCGCVASLFGKLYGEADGAAILRALSIQSKAEADALRTELGSRFEKIIAKVGNFGNAGREIDRGCPSQPRG